MQPVVKKTFETLLEIDSTVAELYRKNPELINGKFNYGYKRFYEKNIKPAIDDYKAKLSDLEIDNALEDPKTQAILTNPDRTFQYSKEGLKTLNKVKKELWEEWKIKEIEIEPYFVKSLPELTEEEVQLITGVLIEDKHDIIKDITNNK